MNKDLCQELFGKVIRSELVNKKVKLKHHSISYLNLNENGNHIIKDARFKVFEEEWQINGAGGSYDCYKIEVFVETLKGKNGIWIGYCLY